MQFLKTLFWVALAILLTLLAKANWHEVTLRLWGDILVEIKLPILILLAYLLGFLPTYFVYRARLWTAQRRAEAQVRHQASTIAEAPVDHQVQPG